MKRAKRNRRQEGRGSAPSPTPIFYESRVSGLTVSEMSMTAARIDGLNESVKDDELSITGLKSNILARLDGTNNFFSPDSITVSEFAGNAVIEYNFVPDLAPGTYIVQAVGFDPAIRGIEGQWLTAFTYVATIP